MSDAALQWLTDLHHLLVSDPHPCAAAIEKLDRLLAGVVFGPVTRPDGDIEKEDGAE
jgi:hypothetical protein